jgi:hypothetical protein
MRIAVVGSRTYPDMSLVKALIGRLHAHDPHHVIVSGTKPPPEGVKRYRADGVDETAIREAERLGMRTVVCEARRNELDAYGKPMNNRAYHKRNGQIVAECDQLVAFWTIKDGTASRGTADTLQMALSEGKIAKVYGTAGEEISLERIGELVGNVLGRKS